jgi:hypothetical protein
MLTPEETISWVKQRLIHLHFRPRMYALTTNGLSDMFHSYLELWAVIYGDSEMYFNAIREYMRDEKSDRAEDIIHYYRRKHPQATDDAVRYYVLQSYREIQRRMELKMS